MKPKPRVNHVDDISSEAATISTSGTVEEQVDQIDKVMQKPNIYDTNYEPDHDDFEDKSVAVSSHSDFIREVEPVNTHIELEDTETKALVDLGSVCTNIIESLANAVPQNIKDSHSIQTRNVTIGKLQM